MRISRFPLLSGLLLCLGACAATDAAASDNCRLQTTPVQVDYGRLSRHAILGQPARAHGHSLGKRLITVNVVCAAPTRLTLLVRGTAAGESGFRFGPQGHLALTATQAVLDGNAISLGVVEQPGDAPSAIAARAPLLPGKGVTAVVDGQASAGSRLSVQIELEAAVPANVLSVTRETDWVSGPGIELVER